MSEDHFEHVREKDHTVLQCLRDGDDNTRAIREATTLSNRDVNYSLDKLEDLGLVDTRTPDGRVTEIVDGEKQNFKAPREASLTDRGVAYFAWTDRERTKYRDMTHDELVERVNELEQDLEDLANRLESFREQVLTKL